MIIESENFPNRGVTREDKIGHLPGFLIQKILSSLPTQAVISTSVLSKEWRSRWKLVPKLKFDSEDYECEHQTFSETVVKSLRSLEVPILDSFNLRFGYDKVDHPQDVESWVRFSFTRNLRKLVLELFIEPYEYEHDYFLFTSSMCTCNTLETLKIRNLIRLAISSPACMKSLKRLHLSFVLYRDEETIHNLLSGCPILEELAVDRSDDPTDDYAPTLEKFTIDVPSLQRLTIYDDSYRNGFLGYTIVAPSLKYLKIKELRCQNFSLNAPELVEADIAGVSSVISEEFRKTIASVKRLFLDVSPLETTYPSIGSIFNHLVYLEMHTHEVKWWDILFTRMLEHSPKLQVLKLVGKYPSRDRVFGREWNKPKYVPKCLLSHLETFLWKRYDWKSEKEEEVAKYILENAGQLKNATFSTIPIAPAKLNKLKRRRKKLEKLACVIRASNSCHPVFKFEGAA